MGIAALGIAMAYLLVVAAVGALWVLVRLFEDTPGEGTGTGGVTVGGPLGADPLGAGGTPSPSVGPGRSEDEAA